MRHSSKRELPRSGIASEIKWVRDKTSQNKSHGWPCDVVPICRGRNSKSVRGEKKRKKNHNMYLWEWGWVIAVINEVRWTALRMEAYRNERSYGIATIWKRKVEMKGIALHRAEMNVGKRSCARDLNQRDIPVSHVKGKIRKCLCDKIIAAWQKWLSL